MGPHVSVPIQFINVNYFIDEKWNAVEQFSKYSQKKCDFFFKGQLTKPEAIVKN